MIRNLITQLVFILLSLLPSSQAEMLIAGVDLTRVLSLHPEAQKTLKELVEERDSIRKQLAQEFEKYQKLVNEGKALEEQFMSPAISENRRRELQAQGAKIIQKAREEGVRLQKFREEKVQQFAQKYQQESRRVIEAIREKINDISRQQGASLVLNTSGRSRSNTTVVQFLEPSLDITGIVLESFGIAADAVAPDSAINLDPETPEEKVPDNLKP